MKKLPLLLALSLAACQTGTQPRMLVEMDQAHDGRHTPGAELNGTFNKDVKRLLMAMTRKDAIAAVEAEGYMCIHGEGHDDYPEPTAQCTASFATRACQMEWNIFLTTGPKKPGKVDNVDGSLTRDCLGTNDDWPVDTVSPIHDQWCRIRSERRPHAPNIARQDPFLSFRVSSPAKWRAEAQPRRVRIVRERWCEGV